jgi:hypothetical protein
MTLTLTQRIRVAELSSEGCIHITVLDKQQLYWVHFHFLDAGQLYDL